MIKKEEKKPAKSKGIVLSYDSMYSYLDTDYFKTYLKFNYFFDNKNLISDFNYNYSSLESRFVRLNTTLRIEDIANIRKIEIGDIYSQDDYMLSIIRMGGIRIGTDYSLRPDIITYPLPDFAGKTSLPSTVDIFVNNAKVFSEDLKPGPFEIKDIPVISPEGEITVVIRDVLGREQIVKVPYMTSLKLLKKGLSEYSVSAGFERKNYFIKDFDYSKFVLSSYYKKGITDRFTILTGSYLRGQDGFNVTGSFIYLMGPLGIISPSVGISYDMNKSATGIKGGIDYSKRIKFINLRLLAMKSSSDFFQPAGVIGTPKDYYNALLGFNLFKFGNLTFSYIRRTFTDAPNSTNINISYTKSLYRRISLSLAYNIYKSSSSRRILRGSINIPLGSSYSSQLTYQKNNNQNYYSARINKNVPEDRLNYSLQTDKTDSYMRFVGRANYRANFADFYTHLSYDTGNGQNDLYYRLGMKGSLIYMDGNFFMEGNYGNSFGIVKIDPPVKDAEVIVNNRPVGKTDEKGILFIPRLYPYNPNEIRINPASLDMKTYIEGNIYSFIPYKEHGYLLKFKAKKMNSVRLKVEFEGDPPPAGTGFYIDGKKAGILGFKGKAFIENITEGRHLVEIDYGYGKCTFYLNITKDILKKTVPFIGNYTCKPAVDSIIVKKEINIKEEKAGKPDKVSEPTKRKEVEFEEKPVKKLVKAVPEKIDKKAAAPVKEKQILHRTINIDSYDEFLEFLEFREDLKM
ncbi:fimbria/pilus outer membrane usher protein [Persephonella sp.]